LDRVCTDRAAGKNPLSRFAQNIPPVGKIEPKKGEWVVRYGLARGRLCPHEYSDRLRRRTCRRHCLLSYVAFYKFELRVDPSFEYVTISFFTHECQTPFKRRTDGRRDASLPVRPSLRWSLILSVWVARLGETSPIGLLF